MQKFLPDLPYINCSNQAHIGETEDDEANNLASLGLLLEKYR